MSIKDLSPDDAVLWQWEFASLNYTILYTWIVMALMVLVSWLATRRLTSRPQMSRWQNFLEIVIGTINNQIRDVSQQKPERYLPFIGTLFLFIVTSNLLAVVPGFHAPTASLSTTAALAILVLVAVPVYGIAHQGFIGYLRLYVHPTPLMLPFNVIGELSRTLALAVRLFGNMMSGAKIGAILLAIAPLFFPIVMHALGLLTGLIQAYIFAILALVYIGSATQAHDTRSRLRAEHNTARAEAD
ncbi:MAG: F0F1 ATP synthase subunit A [Planctomycetota bacterium]|mgnify:CR=1 FL=1|nr:MAG: F0F1 ATP synthase subunit A [Planctomycetota bacterium]REJ89712.1 MAG: F0F1 ATP synthase subunit A [Planctomycetota bacterium]REK26646.1 MAG: F0F1 ATP synthase subunit A [Planctomycetota bacterium]REK47328.1 MAG: F0F1 ATP synthase subunit A [Planctomycetota bacterium]